MNIQNTKIYEDNSTLISRIEITVGDLIEIIFIKLDKETNLSFSIEESTAYAYKIK